MKRAMSGMVVWWLAAGCGSPCERLCENMADYADECGFTVSDADLDTCKAEQKSAESDAQQICRDYGDPEVLRSEWACEDLEVYWEGSATGGSPTE